MIRRVPVEGKEELRAGLCGGKSDDWVRLRMAAALEARGLEDAGCAFYSMGNAVLCLEGAQALVCGRPGDMEELGAFLACCGVRSVFGCQTAPKWGRPEPRMVLSYKGRPNAAQLCGTGLAQPLRVSSAPDLWALTHSGLLEGDPAAAYRALCTRVNCGVGRVWAVCQGERPVAVAAVTAVNRNAAYLGALATAPGWRRRGCAKMLLRTVLQALAPRKVFLICMPELYAFYQAVGFQQHTRTIELILDGP